MLCCPSSEEIRGVRREPEFSECSGETRCQRRVVEHFLPTGVPTARLVKTLNPLPRKRRLPVTGRGAEQDDPRLRLVEEVRQARPLDDVAVNLRPGRDHAL